MKNYYSILEVNRSSTKEEIKKAYKIQAKIWHPDINKSSDAKQRMQDIIEAYLVLSNKAKREEYDRITKNDIKFSGESKKKEETNSTVFKSEKEEAKVLVEKPLEYIINLAKIGISPFKIVINVLIGYFIISLIYYLFFILL